MQQETTKLLVVKTDPSLPSGFDVSMLDLREAILKQPEIIVDALRNLISATTPGTTQTAPGGDLPMDTPIFKMLPPDKAALLTANAKNLTKADLLALGGYGGVPRKTAADLHLTVDDVKTIEEAFHQQFGQQIAASGSSGLMPDISISCCTPCCCCTAAADIQPVRSVV